MRAHMVVGRHEDADGVRHGTVCQKEGVDLDMEPQTQAVSYSVSKVPLVHGCLFRGRVAIWRWVPGKADDGRTRSKESMRIESRVAMQGNDVVTLSLFLIFLKQRRGSGKERKEQGIEMYLPGVWLTLHRAACL